MRQSSVPPAVARSILVTVCSAYGGDVTSYGAGRVTDARQYSHTRELAARQYGLAVPTHRRRVRLFDTLWASAADTAVLKTGFRFHRRRRRTHFCCRHRRQTRGDRGGAGGLPARPDARPRAVVDPSRRQTGRSVFCPQTALPRSPSPPLLPTRPGAMPA